MQSNYFSIGEIAEKAGVRPSALRYYESVGLLPPPERVSGQRRYETSVLRQIEVIQTAQNTGFSIKEILSLLGHTDQDRPYAERLQVLARNKLAEVDALIAQAEVMKRLLEAGLECRCATPEDCLLFIK